MRSTRYQPPNKVNPDAEDLPKDTICTILTRQSTVMQAERNVFSAEVNPQDLFAVARHFGFDDEHIRLVDLDMGIGAYNTTIDDRPGLRTWLYEDLPTGRSKVVLVSNEDRLFRDRYEAEHNQFIAQCAKYGGWAICGSTVYNFRRPFDQDRFRWACKAGKEYIEGHLKRRLHPSIQRAAMRGRYTGGPVTWGYIVDYNPDNPTYKHLQRYEPHAELVAEHVFRVYAAQPQPSVMGVAYHWEREHLIWPFYAPGVDSRIRRVADARRRRDEVRGGYLYDWRQGYHMLTDVNYLGWRVRAGEVAWDTEKQEPLLCHEPIIDPDLFWWCFDRLVLERPSWAPQRTTSIRPLPRPRRPYGERTEDEARTLAPGRVRCAVHGRTLYATEKSSRGSTRYMFLICNGDIRQPVYKTPGCAAPHAPRVDDALCSAFAEQLILDDEDVEAMARLAERRVRAQGRQEQQVRKELLDEQATLTRATGLALKEANPRLADELMTQARQVTERVEKLEAELAHLATVGEPTSTAWTAAQHAVDLAERIRSTFQDWSRRAQSRVLSLAIDDAVIGYVSRKTLGLWIQWKGGSISRREIITAYGRRAYWSDAEVEALQRYYAVASWDALLRIFPGRTQCALTVHARRLGLTRPQEGQFTDTVPVSFATVDQNHMVAYGFGIDGIVSSAGAWEAAYSVESDAPRGH